MIKLKIYTKENCPYCEKAKKLAEYLKNKGIVEYETFDYQALNLTKEDLSKIMGVEVSTLPQIMLYDGDKQEYIGGYTDFDAYAEKREWI